MRIRYLSLMAQNPDGKWKQPYCIYIYFSPNLWDSEQADFYLLGASFFHSGKINKSVLGELPFFWFKHPVLLIQMDRATGLTVRDVGSVVRHLLALPAIPAAATWPETNNLLFCSLNCCHISSLSKRDIVCSTIFGELLRN